MDASGSAPTMLSAIAMFLDHCSDERPTQSDMYWTEYQPIGRDIASISKPDKHFAHLGNCIDDGATHELNPTMCQTQRISDLGVGSYANMPSLGIQTRCYHYASLCHHYEFRRARHLECPPTHVRRRAQSHVGDGENLASQSEVDVESGRSLLI